ncbi:MAG: polysaccharide biosynthesis tyrosine autokinase, partial [Ignavibacteriales bacterium]
VLIIATALIVSIIYAVNARDIYKSTATLKVVKPQGNILYSPVIPEFQDFGNDRFLANEIEVLKTFNTRERVAKSLIDTYNDVASKDSFYILLDVSSAFQETKARLLSTDDIAERLSSAVSIDQKRGLDIIEISAESPSPYEAMLVANSYANEYKTLNLEVNRNQLTIVKNFLLEQRNEKQTLLNEAEETLRKFQERGGVIALDEQANNLIAQLSNFEAQKNAAQIDLMASDKILAQYKRELAEQNPRLADYLKGLSSEAYFTSLQEQLVKLEVNRDIALSNNNPIENRNKIVSDYDEKIKELQNKLNSKVDEIKTGIFASSPAEVKELSQKIIEEEVKNQALKISVSELEIIVKSYESKFNNLPKTAIELARYQRSRESLEKLYTLVEEKYQEALINEQSQPGNVLIIDNARKPSNPSKPNRVLIIIIGLILASGLAFGYVLIKNYFDNTVKTPEDLQSRNIPVLGWVPQFEIEGRNGMTGNEFVVSSKPDSMAGESFRTIRTRIQLTKLDKDSLKTILITSSAPQEGKTVVGINLGGSFAQSNRRTLIIDCDLRKPRVHEIFRDKRVPGLIDYLFGQAQLKDIIHKADINNLEYITCGTIPPNPAEMLESEKMREFLADMREKYDIVILDSPPIIAVTDSEILSTMVDGTILIISADTTEVELMERSVELMKNDKSSFIGAILNNFSYKSGYGSYYKYYYYYSENPPGGKNKSKV